MGNLFDINLQLFAEGDGAAAGADSSNAAAEQGETGGKVFTQAELEDIINKRFAKLQRESDKRVEQARKDGMSEGEKLANMSAEERSKAEREQAESALKAREEELKKREAELARKELRAQAVETLNGKGLPASLADILTYTDAEACNASIATVEKAFRKAVEDAVNARIAKSASNLPRSSAAQETESEVARMTRERSEARAKERERYEKTMSHYMK